MEGKKMSKSFGNIIPLREAVREFGVDPLRLSLVATAGLLQDVDFSPGLARSMRDRLERLYDWARSITGRGGDQSSEGFGWDLPERWLWSRVNRIVKEATAAMDEFRFRDAVQLVLYASDQDVHKYARLASSRSGGVEGDHDLLRRILDLRIRLLAPFTPFICEELWSHRGGGGFVSTADWPNCVEEALDDGVEEAVSFLDRIVEDVKNVVKVLKGKPVKVRLYSASKFKVEAYKRILRGSSMGEAMKALTEEGLNASEAGKLTKAVKRWTLDMARTPESMRAQHEAFLEEFDDLTVLKDAESYLEEELNLQVEVYSEEDPQKVDPAGRAGRAEPLKPAIHVEVNQETL